MSTNNAGAGTLVLNQTNALSIENKHRILLSMGNLWHKVIIHNVAHHDVETVLKAILNATYTLDFIPVNYKIDGNTVNFLARNCRAAIEKLCTNNLIVRSDSGNAYYLTVILGYSNTSDTQLNISDNITNVLNKRFNSQTKILDLENFHKDPGINNLVFCILSKPKMLHYVLQLCKNYNLHGLKLGNNEINALGGVELLKSFKNLTMLDLRNNRFVNMISIQYLTSLNLKELWLDGNPVCCNYAEVGYIQAVKDIFPNLEKLDGLPLSCKGFLAYRRHYCVTHNAARFADQFLNHYFALFDSDRSQLELMYHPNSFFSLSFWYNSTSNTSSNESLSTFKQYARNLLRLSDLSKSNWQLYCGRDDIIKTLCSLPKSQHDPYTLTVDAAYFTNEIVTITITGIFRTSSSNSTGSDNLFGFIRTFILKSVENGEFNIINDMLHVTNASASLANRSLKIEKTIKPVVISLPKPSTSQDKDDNVAALSKISTLNKEWATKFLEEAEWNLKKALELFTEAYKSMKLPSEAFVYR